MKDLRDENKHTVEQIKSAGNQILTKKGEDGLQTIRGNTITIWAETEPNYYTPINAYVREFYV
jgi:hypothetical protein